MKKKWYKLGIENKNSCGNCDSEFHGLHHEDHHLGICPNCEIECIWYTFDNLKSLQIIPKYAPKEFQSFIEWAQKKLDELEFLKLIVSFEELANELNKNSSM